MKLQTIYDNALTVIRVPKQVKRNVFKGTRCPLVVKHKISPPVNKTQANNI